MINLKSSDTVLVTGATGLIGRRLVPLLARSGYRLILLSRRPAIAAELGDGHRIIRAVSELSVHQPIGAVIHLAGEPVASKLWTSRRKQELLRSRAELSREIGEWMRAAAQKPAVWLNASAIGWYGTAADPEQVFTEQSSAGSGFAAQLCAHIEASAQAACDLLPDNVQPRLVHLRIGLVLAGFGEGGYLGKLTGPVKMFLGATLGSGKQWQSWIHIDDAVAAIHYCLTCASLVGPVNLTAPEPARASVLMQELGSVLKRPVFLRVPGFALRLVAGDLADELLLASQRVLPQRLLDAGFAFAHPDLSLTLRQLLDPKIDSPGGEA